MCLRRLIYLYLFLLVSINSSYASMLNDFKWCKPIGLEENVKNAINNNNHNIENLKNVKIIVFEISQLNGVSCVA